MATMAFLSDLLDYASADWQSSVIVRVVSVAVLLLVLHVTTNWGGKAKAAALFSPRSSAAALAEAEALAAGERAPGSTSERGKKTSNGSASRSRDRGGARKRRASASPAPSGRRGRSTPRKAKGAAADGDVPLRQVSGAPLTGRMTALGLAEQDYDLSPRVPQTPRQSPWVLYGHVALTVIAAAAFVAATAGYGDDAKAYTRAWAIGALGGVALVCYIYYYHAAVALFVWAGAVSGALLIALEGAETQVEPEALLPMATPLLAAWIISHPLTQHKFGSQLHMALVGAAVYSIMYVYNLPNAAAGAVIIAILVGPLSPASRVGEIGNSWIMSGFLVAGTGVLVALAVVNDSITITAAAGVCVTLVVCAVIYKNLLPVNFGPFFVHETRSSWISTLAFIGVTLIVAQAEVDPALDAVREQAVMALVRLTTGYAVAAIVVAGVSLLVEQWKSEDAYGVRLVTLDMFLVVPYLIVPAIVVYRETSVGGYVDQAYGVAATATADALLPYVPGYISGLSAVDAAAAAAITLRVIGDIFVRAVVARNLLWAPLVSLVSWRGSHRKDTVALTFNGGPTEETTPKLLDVLRSNDAKATFFVSAKAARESADLLRRMADEGHQIAALGSLEGPEFVSVVRADVRDACDAIEDAVGYRPSSYRPADGNRDARTISAVGLEGLALSLWSVIGWDWGMTPAKVVADEVEKRLSTSGDVLLLHESVPRALPARGSHRSGGVNRGVVDATEELLARLEARGLRAVTLDEVCPPSWEVFKS